jgi:acyl dehydratase
VQGRCNLTLHLVGPRDPCRLAVTFYRVRPGLMTFVSPPEERWFEDYVPGDVHEFGAMAVQEDEILAFGRRFDPQLFHTDPQAAKSTEYGGLIASGWHTASLMMRMYSDHYLSRVATLVSPGVDELRWLLPVRPGDTLSIRVTVLDARRSRSRPDRGIVRSRIEVLNQRRKPVLTVTASNFLLCRPS